MDRETVAETPILDLLKRIPEDARLIYEHSPIHHSMIPVGVLAKEAADRLEALSARVDAVTDKCGKYQQVADEYKARMLELEAENARLREYSPDIVVHVQAVANMVPSSLPTHSYRDICRHYHRELVRRAALEDSRG